jgi:hypothetical protein
MSEKKEQSAIDLLPQYYQQIEKFLKFDELNMKDTQMSLAAVRHYWVGRLMHHKQQIIKLKKYKTKIYKTLKEKIEQESPLDLKPATINNSIISHEAYLKIDEEIANEELIVEFLSKVEMNFRDAQYGLNNLIKIITLETT